MGGGCVSVESENKDISAFKKAEVEVEAEAEAELCNERERERNKQTLENIRVIFFSFQYSCVHNI